MEQEELDGQGAGGFKGKNVGYGSLEHKVQEMGLSGEAEQLQGR